MNENISPPTASTLKKYGLSEEGWQTILERQGGACGVCGKVPNPNPQTGKVRFVIDHEHVRGFKSMPPEEKMLYIRGLTCWYCNHAYLGRGITVTKAEGVVAYLRAYEGRKGEANAVPAAAPRRQPRRVRVAEA